MDPWLVRLDQTLSSYSVLTSILLLIAFIYLLYATGILGAALGLFGRFTRATIRGGFRVWERWLSWADWWVYLLLAVVLIAVGSFFAATQPEVTLLCAAAVLFMGVVACLAFMFIDIERYEVERGYKAVHNPTKGQSPAPNVARYGHRMGVELLAAAAAAAIGGFALLNEGLYETVGRGWYRVDEDTRPGFPEFLTFALIHLLSIVDVLNLADSRQLIHTTFVKKAAWPSGVMLSAFRLFFTLILLQQVFASVRKGRLLAETISDFWSPHEAIHDRARTSLPQFGAAAIGPLLLSLREMTALTREQRDRLPEILAAIGPSTIPTLLEHLSDPHEHVRAVSTAALGHLQAREVAMELARLVTDPSEQVRQSAAWALGRIAATAPKAERTRHVRQWRNRQRWGFSRGKRPEEVRDPTVVAVEALRGALSDEFAAVRCEAAAALAGAGGGASTGVADALAPLLRDEDETVRCQAAEALGKVGGPVDILMPALDDPAAPVRAATARGLKALGRAAAPAVPRLVELLQDRDDAVRAAATDAVTAAGPLDQETATKLAEGLESADNVVRAQAAEALGTVGAGHAAPVLVQAVADDNDVVRAKAVEALGKLGEEAADVAVPTLVEALHDRDSWVSALAAEALGEMGETNGGVVPGLVRALKHLNPLVRANAAEALGKLGTAGASARAALERAAADEDGGVRAQAVRALGAVGPPTPATLKLVRTAVANADPLVRAGAAAAIGAWESPPNEVLADLLPLLRDPNDQVKVQVAEVLSKWEGAPTEVVEGLIQALTEDDSAWVQASAAQALARLGNTAVGAGAALLRAARTGEAAVREEATRALVRIQPLEAVEAFTAGLLDPAAEVRLVASAGWIKAKSVPAEAAPALVEALRDPEPQVRANAANALARLENLPAEAVAPLIECAGDPNDGLRLNAAVALRAAPPAEVAELMYHLLDDPNVRVRLVAAGALVEQNPADQKSAAVVVAAAEDPSPRVREAAEELLPRLASPTPPLPIDPEAVAVAPAP
jgi:HEAT repeat protein